MKICLAQIRSATGEFDENLSHHLKVAENAADLGADIIVFPELSLTGYAPELAEDLATDASDPRLAPFQQLCDSHKISIGIGLPLKTENGITISMLIFEPGEVCHTYSKHFLHSDEEPFFVSGPNYTGKLAGQSNIGISICYEIAIKEHAQAAADLGKDIYLASVAKTAKGVAKATSILQNTARDFGMTVLMANCVGICEGQVAGGGSLVVDKKGNILARLSSDQEELLIYNTDRNAAIRVPVPSVYCLP